MKRNAKQNGSGGRLRWALLLATAAALLLVPAAAASAAGPEVIIKTAGTGSGKVVGEEPFAGSPEINCQWNGTAQSGTCTADATELEPGFWAVEVNHEASPGSEFTGWKIEEGNEGGCEEEKPTAGGCSAFSFGEDIVIKATFKKLPNVHIVLAGKGSGEVLAREGSSLGGTPPVACKWNGTAQSGTCDVEGGAESPFLIVISLEEKALGGSAFKEWEIVKGKEFGGSCFPRTFHYCVAGTLSKAETEVVVKATFTPPPVSLAINTGGGTGTGQVKCKVEGGSEESCATEYPEGTELELIPAPDPGSEVGTVSGTGSASGCASLPCTITLNEASEVNAPFNIQKFALTLNPIGEGTLSAECNGGSCASLTEIPYNTNVVVTAAPNSIAYLLSSLSGSGSASGKCNVGTETCSFAIKANSEVTAEFVAGAIQDTKTAYVHGEVPQTTTLESSCGDVDLGTFEPNLQHDETYAKTCGLTVTSTGAASTLTAADESGEAAGRLGHLVQPAYSLAEPLQTKATDNDGLGGSGPGLTPLTSPVTLLSWGVPVNDDSVTLEFSQLIKRHDPLHTGEYAKTITLTLKQTA